jgi:prepilin-type N-terminal cleavage/methylation domain-containing protein
MPSSFLLESGAVASPTRPAPVPGQAPGSWSRERSAGGFTLIEVIGALVIFSVGVLMVFQVSGALGTQMRYAGARSELAVMAGERLDSLAALPISSLTPGTTVDTVTMVGMEYECTVLITSVTPVLSRIDVSLAAIDGYGPSHSVTSYASEPW